MKYSHPAKRYAASILVIALCGAIAAPSTASDSSRLDALAGRYWRYELSNNFALQMELGVPIRHLRAPTLEASRQSGAFGASVLRDLSAIDPGRLDHDRWLTYREIQYDAQGLVGDAKYYWFEQQITPYQQPYAYMLQVFSSFRFANGADGARYVALLHDVARWARSARAFVAGQHERRIILPNVETDAAVAALQPWLAPAASSPYHVDPRRLTALSPADARTLESTIDAAIDDDVAPAFKALVAYLGGAYRVGAPTGVGQSQYPGGKAYYLYMVSRVTTLDLTPQQIHAIGLQQVALLNRKIDDVQKAMGFKGSAAAFREYLKTDPRFFATSGAEIGDRLEWFVGRVARRVPLFYDRLPTAPYGVEPLPANLAGAETFGYYDAPTAGRVRGIYRYNASHPRTTWLPQAGALIMHELIPGHHFQISLQQENDALPPVRRYDFSVVAYVEGYAEYSSQLGFDMGLYGDPYYRVGRLMQDMMVSCRLVVDTGMNDMGWSLARAQRFMRDNTVLTEHQIETETLRYSLDLPAQALGYKLGELTILAYRADAKRRLGSRYDVREFHRWLIGSGTMTLATLRAHLEYEEALAARH